MKNQEGFALTSILILLPVVLVTFFSFLLAIGLIKKRVERNHLCHKVVLEIQKKQSDFLTALLSLNPAARQLQQQRKVADKALDAAIKTAMPKIIAAAKAYQLIVIARQVALRRQQQQILTRSQTDIDSQWSMTKINYSKLKTQVGNKIRPLRLPVISVNKQTGSPTFKTKPDIEHLQHLQIQWKWKMPKEWEPAMRSLQLIDFHLSGSCAGTLRKRSRKWKAELSMARSL